MSKPGHNSGKGGPIAADRLKSFIERIEKLEEERKAIGGDIKDVYAEAKGVGYDVKTMRKVVSLRGMDAADRAEQETMLDVYWHALTQIDRVEARVAGGESIRQAAKAEGMPKSTAIRQVTQNREKVENGSDEEAGTGSATVVATGNLDALSPDAAPLQGKDLTTVEPESEAPAPVSVGAVAAEPRVAPQTDLEMPEIPSFLDRRTAQGRETGSPSAPHPAREQGGFEQ